MSHIITCLNQILIVDKPSLALYLVHKKIYSNSHSAHVNINKQAKNPPLVDCGKFVKLETCKSDYKEHAQALSHALLKFLYLPYETTIFREKTIPGRGLRPDAIILQKNGDRARCVVLEVCLTETQEYLNSKINALDGISPFLSELFGVNIPWFDVVVEGLTHPKALTLTDYLGGDV